MILDHTNFEYVKSYLGEQRTRALDQFLSENKCQFRTTRPRISKRGDFRIRGRKLEISVNRDTNKYRFILTLVHELAHLKTHRELKNRAKPHGLEWKKNHEFLFRFFDLESLFADNEDLRWLIEHEMKNPKACSGVDIELERVLARFDQEKDERFLEDLPLGSTFRFRNKEYKKLEDRRSRVLCLSISNSRKYTIHKASKVIAC